MPPFIVYAHINKTDIMALRKKGRCNGSNTVICNTNITINNLNQAPISFDNKNSIALVLYDILPNRCSIYP